MSARLLTKVRIVAIFLLCGFPVVATAQKEPIEVIEDNSFLIEEAYNQEPGVVQHIFQSVYSSGPRQRGWAFAFTQEWPIYGQDHQFSYTVLGYHLINEGERQHGGRRYLPELPLSSARRRARQARFRTEIQLDHPDR